MRTIRNTADIFLFLSFPSNIELTDLLLVDSVFEAQGPDFLCCPMYQSCACKSVCYPFNTEHSNGDLLRPILDVVGLCVYQAGEMAPPMSLVPVRINSPNEVWVAQIHQGTAKRTLAILSGSNSLQNKSNPGLSMQNNITHGSFQ